MGGGEAAREEFHMNWCMISPSSPGSDNQRTGGRKGKSCHQASLLNTILVGTRKSWINPIKYIIPVLLHHLIDLTDLHPETLHAADQMKPKEGNYAHPNQPYNFQVCSKLLFAQWWQTVSKASGKNVRSCTWQKIHQIRHATKQPLLCSARWGSGKKVGSERKKVKCIIPYFQNLRNLRLNVRYVEICMEGEERKS